MDENDGIAGRYEHDFVGFSSQVGGIYTYYFNEHEFLNAYMACKQNGEITAAEDYALQAVQAYWHEENTARKVELEFSKRCALRINKKPFGKEAPGFTPFALHAREISL